MYNYFAFDFFDTIMCSGKHQIDSIRKLEKLRKTKKKNTLQTGLTYYDIFNQTKSDLNINKEKQKKDNFISSNMEKK